MDLRDPPTPIRLVLLACAATALVAAGLFIPGLPLWVAGLPLLAGVVADSRPVRFVMATAFFTCPALIAAWGLTQLRFAGETEIPHLAIWAAAVLFTVLLSLLIARAGIVPVSLALFLLPPFPANPLLLLADVLPDQARVLPPLLCVVVLAFLEHLPDRHVRATFAATLCAVLAVVTLNRTAIPPPLNWIEHPVPVSITERAGWIRLRDSLPEGSEAILGENLFAEEDTGALAFWRQAAREKNLTLWTGAYTADGRGRMLRFSPGTGPIPPEPVAAARYGIPGITGTWRRMPTLEESAETGTSRMNTDMDWLFCYEALLPRAWVPLVFGMVQPDRPVIVLANDRWLHPLPFHVTRRKVARAMAGLAGRPVFFAETGRSFLLRTRREDN